MSSKRSCMLWSSEKEGCYYPWFGQFSLAKWWNIIIIIIILSNGSLRKRLIFVLKQMVQVCLLLFPIIGCLLHSGGKKCRNSVWQHVCAAWAQPGSLRGNIQNVVSHLPSGRHHRRTWILDRWYSALYLLCVCVSWRLTILGCAGFVGGFIAFGDSKGLSGSVNNQIVLYLFAR